MSWVGLDCRPYEVYQSPELGAAWGGCEEAVGEGAGHSAAAGEGPTCGGGEADQGSLLGEDVEVLELAEVGARVKVWARCSPSHPG